MTLFIIVLILTTLAIIALEYKNALKNRIIKKQSSYPQNKLNDFKSASTKEATKMLYYVLYRGVISMLILTNDAKKFNEKKSRKKFTELVHNEEYLNFIKQADKLDINEDSIDAEDKNKI